MIITDLKDHLLSSTSAVQITSGLMVDVNDFPSIAIFNPTINEENHLLKFMMMEIRGYVWDETDSLDKAEALAAEIDAAMETFNSSGVFSSVILEVSTDQGLLTPYGICDLIARIDYCD